jgi:hypothetical protein
MSQLRVSSVTDLSGAGSTYAPGHVVQVRSTPKTDVFTTSSTTYTPITGLTASITPTSATSKILITVQLTWGFPTAANTNAGTFRLTGGNSAVYRGNPEGSRRDAVFGGNIDTNLSAPLFTSSIVFLDSPNTTSATTYGMECVTVSGGTIQVNRPGNTSDGNIFVRGASSITLMEIAQ